jgi:hypothetical protein
VGIAAVLAVFNAVLIGFAVTNPSLTGNVSTTLTPTRTLLLGIGVLVVAVLLYFYRRLVQDKSRVVFREQVPAQPSPEQMALLREEEAVPAE